MAPILLKEVVIFSSEDPRFPAHNVLKGQKWMTNPKDNSGKAGLVIQLDRASQIHFVDIGFSNVSSLEVTVGRSSWPSSREHVVLLPTVILQTPLEARAGKNKTGCKMYKYPEHLHSEHANEKWDRVRIQLNQPFVKNKQIGLEFIRLGTPRNVIARQDLVQPSSNNLPKTENSWKNSSIAMLARRSRDSSSQSVVELEDKLLRISSTTEDGSNEKSTLSRTAKMVLASRSNKSPQGPKKLGQSTPPIKKRTSLLCGTPKRGTSENLPSNRSIQGLSKGGLKSSSNHGNTNNTPNQKNYEKQKINTQHIGNNIQNNLSPKISDNAQIRSKTPYRFKKASTSSHLPASETTFPDFEQPSSSEVNIRSYGGHSFHMTESGDSKQSTSGSISARSNGGHSFHTTESGDSKQSTSGSTSGRSNGGHSFHMTESGDSKQSTSGNITARSNGGHSFHMTESGDSKQSTSKNISAERRGSNVDKDCMLVENEISGHMHEDKDSKIAAEMESSFSKSKIKKLKLLIQKFFNTLDMDELDPDKITLKELRTSFEAVNDVKLDKNGRQYFRSVTSTYLQIALTCKQHKQNGNRDAGPVRSNNQKTPVRKRKSSESVITSSPTVIVDHASPAKVRRMSSHMRRNDSADCEIVSVQQNLVQCPLCMKMFPQSIITDHAAICGEEFAEIFNEDDDVHITSVSSTARIQTFPQNTGLDLSDNMRLSEDEKRYWLNFTKIPKAFHPRMDKSLLQGSDLRKCPTCGQFYRCDEIQEHSDDCAEKVNSGLEKRGLYYVKKQTNKLVKKI